MKVIKEALLGKVSRLFKHGALAIRRFNTKAICRAGRGSRSGRGTHSLQEQQTREQTGRTSPFPALLAHGCHSSAGSAPLCQHHPKLLSPAWKEPGGAHRVRQLLCLTALRSGCTLPSIPSPIQHIRTAQTSFPFRRDLPRLSAALQPPAPLWGTTAQHILWLMESPIRLHIFIKDGLVSS